MHPKASVSVSRPDQQQIHAGPAAEAVLHRLLETSSSGSRPTGGGGGRCIGVVRRTPLMVEGQ